MRNRFLLLLLPLLAVGLTSPAWSQDAGQFSKPTGKCDPSRGHCISTIVFSSTRDHTDLPLLMALARSEIYRISLKNDERAKTSSPRRVCPNAWNLRQVTARSVCPGAVGSGS